MSHFVALKECLLTFWLNGLTKAKHVKYRSSIGVSSMVGRDAVYVEELHDTNASTNSGWYFANLRYDARMIDWIMIFSIRMNLGFKRSVERLLHDSILIEEMHY